MNRRQLLGAAGVAATAGLAGCTEAFGQEEDTAFSGNATSGGLIAESVESVPADATVVNATTGRVGSVKSVQAILEQVADGDRSYALLSLDGEAFSEAESALEGLPYYEGEEGDHGYYLQFDGTTLILYQYYRK